MQQLLTVWRILSKTIDWWLLGGIFFLITMGLLIQYSIGLNQDHPDTAGFYKQLFIVFLGSILFIVGHIFGYRAIHAHPLLFYIPAILVLIAVLLFGTTLKGATGWFIIGSFSFQPVELVKLLSILALSNYLAENPAMMQQRKHFFITGIATALIVGLTLIQPDTGSAFIIFMIWFGYALFLKVPAKFIGLVLGTVLLAGIIGWFFLFPSYQKDRLVTFLHPTADPLGAGYNVTQSIVAVGSGGMWGKGLGLGTQSQLHFLPEVSTDFIFAVIAEEFGFFGVLLFLTALGVVLYRLWKYLTVTKKEYAFLTIVGTMIYLIIQSTMVMGMNTGILPVTGVPLPLVSAGGSSMLMTLFILGIAHSIGTAGRNVA